MDKIKSFIQYHSSPMAMESVDAGTATMIGLGALTLYLIATDRKAAKRQKQAAAVQANQHKNEEIRATKLNNWQKYYGIQLTPYPDGAFSTKQDVIKSLVKDLNEWLTKIKSSQPFKQAMVAAVKRYNANPSAGDPFYTDDEQPISVSWLTNAIKIQKGVNGWEETVEICDEDQSVCVFFADIGDELADMLRISYQNYLTNINTGDGDEGHIYYKIKMK